MRCDENFWTVASSSLPERESFGAGAFLTTPSSAPPLSPSLVAPFLPFFAPSFFLPAAGSAASAAFFLVFFAAGSLASLPGSSAPVASASRAFSCSSVAERERHPR